MQAMLRDLADLASLEKDVVEMLCVDASDALPAWLGARLRQYVHEAQPRVMQVQSMNAARVKAEGGVEDFYVSDPGDLESALRPTHGDAALMQALRNRESLEEGSAGRGYRYLVVLHSMEEARYVVEMSSPGSVASHRRARELAVIGQAYFDRLANLETDALTKLRNRRVFQAHVDARIRGWTRAGRPHCLAMLDIDHFKRVNDQFGHLYGDEILVHFANVMRRTFRAGDMMYRFGGEEFVVVYATEGDASGETALERFRAAVESYAFPGVGRITVSIGFAHIRDASTPAAMLVDRADQAVYVAKSVGRNRVCSWEQLVAAGVLQEKATGRQDVTLF